MRHIRRLIPLGLKLALVAVTLAIGIGGTTAFAKDKPTSGLTISPTSADVVVAPGGTYSGQMLVLNQSDVDATYKVYATPYSVNGEEYKPYFSPIKGAIDISKWFTFANKGGNLKVGAQDTVPFTIQVPKGTGAGSYFATVFAETEDKGSQGVVTRKRVGMIVYLRVSGKAIERGNVAAWNVASLQQPPFAANVKIANSGSVHFKAKVHTTVSDLFGGQKFSHTQEVQVLPQKLRRIPVVWKDGATFGVFKVGGEVKYLHKTEKLPTKYVLIASTSMRIVSICVLLALVAVLVYVGKRRVAAHKR